MAFQVKLEQFEGPLDLLLTLISRREVDIYDISISEITDEYLSYIEKLRELNLEIASEFLLIAATLLEIKSRGLLPNDELEPTEPLSTDEVRKELIKKLINYKKFKNTAAFLKQSFEIGSKYYERQAELEACFIGLMPDFDEEINPIDLAQHLLHLVRVRHFALVNTNHITAAPLSVEDQIEYVLDELKRGPLGFKQMTDGLTRYETIVTFLAVLELYKRIVIDIKQAANFGQIELELIS